MTDIYATVTCPLAVLDTARTIGIPSVGNSQWGFTRALTTDPTGAGPATHYGSSGQADAALLALIVQLPGVSAHYTGTWQEALADDGLRVLVEEI